MGNKKVQQLLMALTLIIALLALLMPSIASASVTYSDWRWSTPDVFSRYGSEWTQQYSGGYDNSSTYWKCYPANGWTYATLNATRESGTWHTPAQPYATGNVQAYITVYGTSRRVNYFCGYYSHYYVNQYSIHGWYTVFNSTEGGYGHVSSEDFHDGYQWSSDQKVCFDAVRIYY
ncbi:MAG: hypothetical protein K6T91_09780 [Firmicutes bacterium]|nr:hypothetical protein [Bacillota bacterium]